MIRAFIPALVLLASPALADDPRLVEKMYDPMEVVRIEGKVKVQATISFADDEQIENVAVGDSEAWQVTPNKRANLLFVKPLSPTATTNMTVVTDKRTYLFDLVAGARAKPLYVLQFKYPPEPESEKQPVMAEGPNEVELAAAQEAGAVVDPAELNFAWTPKGDKGLLPARTYDDGNSTFLTWSAGKPVPAILVKDYEGTEGPVNFSVRGDVIVLEGVPREIILRSGRDSATLTNTGPVREAAPVREQTAFAQNGARAGENR